ncbi:MAG: hypothetical protein COA57_15700 [Flavobacteriales bacterium]|nr:MAG: hypothetical protein COA57_15700 [Flavobacteriales bacterium]
MGLFAQGVAINPTGASPDNSAIFDVNSTTKGNLFPRMTTAQRDAIASPANGLIIYNIDCNNFNYYNGSAWIPINSVGGSAPATPGAITGNTIVCVNATGEAYSISIVSGATAYTWIVPAGATVATGQGTTAITVDYGSTAGNVCVTASNNCGTSAASCTAITINTAPAAPTATVATGITSTAFDANWTASGGATTYYLDVATDAGFTAFISGYNNNNVGNVTTHTITTTLTCGTTYYYRVRASNACATSANSNTITQATASTPSTPTATAATGITSSAFTANWTSVSGATSYRLDVSTVNTFSSYVSGYNNKNVGGVTSSSVTGLACGTTYYYRVRAVNSCATSGNSNTITVNTTGGLIDFSGCPAGQKCCEPGFCGSGCAICIPIASVCP